MFDSFCLNVLAQDKWRKPALNEKAGHNPEQLSEFISKVETIFDLPQGTLKTKSTRLKINGVYLADVKKAAIYRISEFSTVSMRELAPYLGSSKRHSIVWHHLNSAKDLIDCNDASFAHCYSLIQSIAV